MLDKSLPLQSFFPTQRFTEMKFGTRITASGTRFRLWAPLAQSIGLRLEGEPEMQPMQALPRGWFELEVEGVGHGALYRFILPDGTPVPDPASRFQPQDVLGPSEVIDPRRYQWQDVGWVGRPWEEAVLYELHLGTFTPEGTFLAAIERLDHLVDLGITAIQLMPVNDFPGRWNWGYDGALPFAPDSTYGRPEDLKALIDAAHQRSVMVLLDVVYNHFGPKGNYLPKYTPIFNPAHSTPWGDAVNFDGEGSEMVRDLMIANARYWLQEYHFDGLRLDAVHEIRDEGFNHMLHDLALQVRGATDGRYTHLVLENEFNDPKWLRRTFDLRAGLYDAQWNDDVHHLIDVVMIGERSNYQADYADRPDWLARALATGFGYQGELTHTTQLPKGGPSADLPPMAFVSFIQNHDQIGNRLFGERVAELAEPRRMRAAIALYLLAPQIPLLFMGEEWGTKRPFLFFYDVDPEFHEAVVVGRKERFGAYVPKEKRGIEPPDPMAESSFLESKLDWSELQQGDAADILALYRELIHIRTTEIVPLLTGVEGYSGSYEMVGGQGFKVEWRLAGGKRLTLLANLTDEPLDGIEVWHGRHLWLEGVATGTTLEPWSVVWSLADAGEDEP
ncbi:MAG TPA: malto-oligosyltrehalose trehalohydrolase [Devosiaceae bacterium]|nr:malto-oligosyltrehalose trehalohydrolase [Devosiaceae bacterium]